MIGARQSGRFFVVQQEARLSIMARQLSILYVSMYLRLYLFFFFFFFFFGKYLYFSFFAV